MDVQEKGEVIEDLTHYLMGMRAKKKSSAEPVVGNPKAGRDLFRSTGCVACHGTEPMVGLDEKYAPGELAKFLMNPLAARPSGRMPEQKLGKKDAAHLAAYLAPKPPAEGGKFVVDAERAGRGRKVFMSMGCVSCHGKQQEPKSSPLIANLQSGCLSEEPKKGVPHYTLQKEQRSVIRVALEARRKLPPSAELEPKVAVRRLMLQRNCFACHTRDGIGGPPSDVAAHFTSTKDDLGDLGRLPPPLDGVGRKIQKSALENVLRGRDPVRHYMRVRMPGFGEELARGLSSLLARTDVADSKDKQDVAVKNPEHAGTNAWGRELVGITGYACIVCHDINGQPSLGIGAYDLAEMPRRLRPEWMREFLLNPAAFPTGTRMPPFWPGGKPMNPGIGGGTTERQMNSILQYLAEVDESLPPKGIADRATLVLKPAERPIVFRTFLKGTGTHAIAVGFPREMNVAFDALAVRWSIAWRGKFIDADGTWNQRYIKMEQPLGEELVKLEEMGTLSIAGQAEVKPVFRGYRLDKGGVPIFEYELGTLQVEDRIDADTKSRGLKRTLRITGQSNEVVQLTAHPPKGVKVERIGGSVSSAPVEFLEGRAEIVEEITW
jgi:mono/diheme cytochrome c family protein